MKKYLLLLLTILLLIPINLYAKESANVTLSKTSGNVSIGNIITVNVKISSSKPISYYEYTLSYNSKKLNLISGKTYTVERTNDSDTKSISKNYKFKVLDTSASKITVDSYSILDTNNKELNVTVSPITIGTKKTNTNNYLSDLKIDGYNLSPKFDKKVTEYKLAIDKDTENLNIKATAENKNSIIQGDGEISVTSSSKKIEISVTSDEGEELVYTINLIRSNSSKITVTIDGKKYTLLKDASIVDIPEGYSKKTIIIEKTEISALYNNNTGYTLVALEDEDKNIELYIYNEGNGEYTKYKTIIFNGLEVILLKLPKTLKDYNKYKITINEEETEVLKLSNNSRFALVYAMNIKTGNKSWYSYDSENNTLQEYNEEINSLFDQKINKTKTLIYILSGTTLILGIISIVLAVKLNKKRRI